MLRCNCSEQVESEIEESEVYIRLFPVEHKKLFFSRIIQGSLSSISFTKPTLILLHHDEAGYLWRSFKWIKLADVGHHLLGSAEKFNKRQINFTIGEYCITAMKVLYVLYFTSLCILYTMIDLNVFLTFW